MKEAVKDQNDEHDVIARELAKIPISEPQNQTSLLAFVKIHGAKLRARKDAGASWEDLADYLRAKLSQPSLKTSSLKSYMAEHFPSRPKPVRHAGRSAGGSSGTPGRSSGPGRNPGNSAGGDSQQTEKLGVDLPVRPPRLR